MFRVADVAACRFARRRNEFLPRSEGDEENEREREREKEEEEKDLFYSRIKIP